MTILASWFGRTARGSHAIEPQRMNAETRRLLGRLSPRMLQDIGVDPELFTDGLHTPFWQRLASEAMQPAVAELPRGSRSKSVVAAALHKVASLPAAIYPCRA